MSLFCIPFRGRAVDDDEETPLLQDSAVLGPAQTPAKPATTWKYPLKGNTIDMESIATDTEFEEFVKHYQKSRSKYTLVNIMLDKLDNTVVVPFLNDADWVAECHVVNLGQIWTNEDFRTFILCEGYRFISKVTKFTLEMRSDLSNITLMLLKEIIEICPNLKELVIIPLQTSTAADFYTCDTFIKTLSADYTFEVFKLEKLTIGSFYHSSSVYKVAIIKLFKIFLCTQLRAIEIINIDLQLNQLSQLLACCTGVNCLQLFNTNIKFSSLFDTLCKDYELTQRQLRVLEFHKQTRDNGYTDLDYSQVSILSNIEHFHISGNSNKLIEDVLPLLSSKARSLKFDYLYDPATTDWVSMLSKFTSLTSLCINMKFIKYMVSTPEALALAIRNMTICDGINELGLIGNFDDYKFAKSLVMITQTAQLNQLIVSKNVQKKILDALKDNNAIQKYKTVDNTLKRNGPPIGYECWYK